MKKVNGLIVMKSIIQKALISMGEKEYREFSSKLMPQLRKVRYAMSLLMSFFFYY